MIKYIVISVLILQTANCVKAQVNIDTASYNHAIEQVNFDAQNFVVIGEHYYINNTFATEYFII